MSLTENLMKGNSMLDRARAMADAAGATAQGAKDVLDASQLWLDKCRAEHEEAKAFVVECEGLIGETTKPAHVDLEHETERGDGGVFELPVIEIDFLDPNDKSEAAE